MIGKEDIKSMLYTLTNYQAQIDSLNLTKQALIDKILTPEIKAQIADIEAEFADKTFASRVNAAELEEKIKTAVIANGATVKGTFLQAVYAKGRTTWDTAGLKGYELTHPEISVFKKIGEPSVSLRNVKE